MEQTTPNQETLRSIIHEIRKNLYSARERAYAAIDKLEGSPKTGESGGDAREPQTFRELLYDISYLSREIQGRLGQVNATLTGAESYDTPQPCETAQYNPIPSSFIAVRR